MSLLSECHVEYTATNASWAPFNNINTHKLEYKSLLARVTCPLCSISMLEMEAKASSLQWSTVGVTVQGRSQVREQPQSPTLCVLNQCHSFPVHPEVQQKAFLYQRKDMLAILWNNSFIFFGKLGEVQQTYSLPKLLENQICFFFYILTLLTNKGDAHGRSWDMENSLHFFLKLRQAIKAGRKLCTTHWRWSKVSCVSWTWHIEKPHQSGSRCTDFRLQGRNLLREG